MRVCVYKLMYMATFLVLLAGQAAYAQETTVKPPEINVTPQAPKEVSGFFSRLLGFAMFIAWAFFIGSLVWTGVQFMQGDKEAPQRLRNVLIGGFLVSFALTIAYFFYG